MLTLRANGESMAELPLDSQHLDGNTGSWTVAVDRKNVPKSIRLGLVSRTTAERMGPETDVCVIPDLPEPFAVRLYWTGNGLKISWDPFPLTGHFIFKCLFQALGADDTSIDSTSVWADIADTQAFLPEKILNEALVTDRPVLHIRQQMYLAGNNLRLKGKIWDQMLPFSLLKLRVAPFQYDLSKTQPVLPTSTVLGMPYLGNNAVDFCCVDETRPSRVCASAGTDMTLSTDLSCPTGPSSPPAL